jgi:peroxiredoxin
MKTRVTLLCLILALSTSCAKGPQTGSGRLTEGQMAPLFQLFDIFGQSDINSAKLFHSNNATVVIIWSMNCPICRDAMAQCQTVYEEYHSQAIAFVGVNFDVENIQGVRAFLKGEGITFDNAWDNRGRVARQYKAFDYTFSFFVVGRDGRLIAVQYDHPPDLAAVLSDILDRVLEARERSVR